MRMCVCACMRPHTRGNKKFQNPEIMITICVDASVTDGNPGIAEYRGLNLETNEVLFEFKFKTRTSNNIAEWVAIVNAIQFAKDNGLKNVTIYSDSQTALSWVRKRRHKSKIEFDYPQFFSEEIKKILEYNNSYLQNNSHNFNILFWDKKKFKKEIPADYNRK